MAKTSTFTSCAPVVIDAQLGVSVLELMIACALGLFLILGLVTISANVKKIYGMENILTGMQENGLFAVHFLAQNIRMAGYKGCEASPPFTNSDLTIQGYQNALPPFLQGKVASNTDSVVVGLCRKENNSVQFENYAYFIGATSRKNSLGKKIYALYEEPQNGDKRELVADIENMRISYGIATADDEDIGTYVNANQVSDWHAVRAVDISLLLNSEDPVFLAPHAYYFVNNIVQSDRYLHREWEVYIKLREH